MAVVSKEYAREKMREERADEEAASQYAPPPMAGAVAGRDAKAGADGGAEALGEDATQTQALGLQQTRADEVAVQLASVADELARVAETAKNAEMQATQALVVAAQVGAQQPPLVDLLGDEGAGPSTRPDDDIRQRLGAMETAINATTARLETNEKKLTLVAERLLALSQRHLAADSSAAPPTPPAGWEARLTALEAVAQKDKDMAAEYDARLRTLESAKAVAPVAADVEARIQAVEAAAAGSAGAPLAASALLKDLTSRIQALETEQANPIPPPSDPHDLSDISRRLEAVEVTAAALPPPPVLPSNLSARLDALEASGAAISGAVDIGVALPPPPSVPADLDARLQAVEAGSSAASKLSERIEAFEQRAEATQSALDQRVGRLKELEQSVWESLMIHMQSSPKVSK